MRILLETERLVLREAGPNDAAFMLELMNERNYIDNIGDRGVRTLEAAGTYIESKYTANYQTLGYGLYVVERKSDAVPLGICGFVKREVLDNPDIGFAFLERFHYQGYGYESGAATLEYGKTTLKFPRVFGVTKNTNRASIRLLEKLGLTYDKDILLPGYAEPSLLYSIVL